MAKDYDFGWLGIAVKLVYILVFIAIIFAIVILVMVMFGLWAGFLSLFWKQILPAIMEFSIYLLVAIFLVVGSWVWRKIKTKT